MSLGFILVLTIQHLHFCVLDKRVIHILAALDVKLQVHVALLSGALVHHIDALHKVEGMSFKQVVDSPLDFGVLEADTSTCLEQVNLVEQHSACMRFTHAAWTILKNNQNNKSQVCQPMLLTY